MERHTIIAAQRRFVEKTTKSCLLKAFTYCKYQPKLEQVQTQRGASRPKWGGFNPGMKLLAQNVEFHVCLGALSNAFNAFESVSKRFGRRSQIVGGRLRKHRRAPVHNAIHKESALGSDHHYACQSFLAAARLP